MIDSMRMIVLLLLAGAVTLCSSCAPQAVTPTESPVETPPPSTPVETTAFESPIEPTTAAEPSRPSCLTVIEPKGNTACGYVVHADSGEPIVGRPVFLAEAVFSDDNSVVLAALDRERAPQDVTDEKGLFSIRDVPSDLYFVQLDEYPKPIMLHEPDEPSNDLIVDWRDKEGAVDLGVIPAVVLDR